MPGRIRIRAGGVSVTASLNDSATAEALWEALPLSGTANRWGEEIYFAVPFTAETEPTARADMSVGEIAYWPPGRAFCIFFGPTPASTTDQPRAASEVNPLGFIEGDAAVMGTVPEGEQVFIERVEE